MLSTLPFPPNLKLSPISASLPAAVAATSVVAAAALAKCSVLLLLARGLSGGTHELRLDPPGLEELDFCRYLTDWSTRSVVDTGFCNHFTKKMSAPHKDANLKVRNEIS